MSQDRQTLFLDRIHPVCEAFEDAWQSGNAPDIGTYLSGWQGDERKQLFKYLLELDLDYRRRAGNAAAPDTYMESFPEYATIISRLSEADTKRSQDTAAGNRGINNPAANGPMPSQFGDYELLEEIARGGMGVVYRARQRSADRIVALKMILQGQFAGREEIERFRTEAKAAANLTHPGIVPVYEVGEIDGRHFFSMGIVEGPSLSQRLREGPLPPREAAEIVRP